LFYLSTVFIYRKKHPNLKAIFALVMETVNHRENLEELAERVNLWTQVLFKGTAAGDLSISLDHDFGRLNPDPYWEC
jgi:hypothetical protein